jgi:hypothetical protein
MSRLTITLTAAAASALVAAATVALPALGDDPPNAPTNAAALAACLRSHGLAGAPDDALALKPWIAQRQAQDPDGVKRAMMACEQFLTPAPDGPKSKRDKPRELSGPDVQELLACMRANGLDPPRDPAALKRWLQQKEASDPDAIKRVIPTCKMQLDPGAAKAAKPGVCGDDAPKSGGEPAKPEETQPAEPSTSSSTHST